MAGFLSRRRQPERIYLHSLSSQRVINSIFHGHEGSWQRWSSYLVSKQILGRLNKRIEMVNA